MRLMAKTITLFIEKRGCVTNGDVMQAMFPHYTIEIESLEGFVRCSYHGWYIRLPIVWWDAPYKAGDINDKL